MNCGIYLNIVESAEYLKLCRKYQFQNRFCKL